MCPFQQHTIAQILSSNEAFSRFETILEVSWGWDLAGLARSAHCPRWPRGVLGFWNSLLSLILWSLSHLVGVLCGLKVAEADHGSPSFPLPAAELWPTLHPGWAWAFHSLCAKQ